MDGIKLRWKCLFEAQHSPCYIVNVKYLDWDILASSDAKDFVIKPFKGPFEWSQIDDMINRISKKCFYELQILIDDRNVNKSTYITHTFFSYIQI